MTRNVRVGSRGLAHDMYVRMHGFGIQSRSTHCPNFPRGFDETILSDHGGLGDEPHICEEERIVTIPTVLVADVVVRAHCGDRFALDQDRFDAFFSAPVQIYHDGMYPDENVWEPVESIYAVSCLGQNPWLGSVRFRSPHTRSGYAQAYIRDGQVIVSESGSSIGHHLMYKQSRNDPCFRVTKKL